MKKDENGFFHLTPKAYSMKQRIDQDHDVKKIIFRHGHIAITNYKMGDNPEFEKSLSVFDEIYWKYRPIGFYYVKPLKEMRVNRGYDVRRLREFFPNHIPTLDNHSFSYKKNEMRLTVPPRDDYQKMTVSFMAGEGQYKSNKNFTQIMIDLNVGKGKAQPDDTLIPTPDGWKYLDSLAVGDMVFNRYGKPVPIIGIYPQGGLRDTYQINFYDMKNCVYRSTRCNIDHLWVVKYYPSDTKEYVITTRDMLEKLHFGIDIYIDSPYICTTLKLDTIIMVDPTYQRCIEIDDPEHIYLTEEYIPTHNTYCGVAISCFHKARVCIFVPIAKLLDQWKQSFLEFTDLTADDILCVQGSDMCMKIMNGKYKHVKVFIFMVDTIASFASRYGPMMTMDMLESTNAYLKIIDEVHLDIKAISLIEGLCNFHMNYYLSASPGRTASKENWIFKTLFFNVPKFGSKQELQSEKHLNIMIKYYRFMPDQSQMKHVINPRKKWLNTKAYETALFTSTPQQRADFENSLIQLLNWCNDHLADGKKMILFCNTIDGTEYLKNVAEKIFPGECSRYYGTLASKTEKEEALKAKVICATVSSLGTGTDLKGLQFCINTCTYSSKIEAVQVSGRLRKIEGVPVVYMELVNVGWYKTLNQYEKRKPALISRSRTGKLIVID